MDLKIDQMNSRHAISQTEETIAREYFKMLEGFLDSEREKHRQAVLLKCFSLPKNTFNLVVNSSNKFINAGAQNQDMKPDLSVLNPSAKSNDKVVDKALAMLQAIDMYVVGIEILYLNSIQILEELITIPKMLKIT